MTPIRSYRSWPENLTRRLQVTDAGCVEYTGYLDPNGYGRVNRGPHAPAMLAHRAAYELFVGPIPPGLTLDHLCQNRACVNPGHLEPVTQQLNVARAAAVKTHCPQGHSYDAANTYVDPSGGRRCRACHREEARRRHRARVAA